MAISYFSKFDIDPVVRIDSVVLDSIKSVMHGEIVFTNPRRPEGARIVGLYGQNGSGKSTFIETLDMLRQCMSGRPIDAKAADQIDVNSPFGRVECGFSIELGNERRIEAIYSFCIGRGQQRADGASAVVRDSTMAAGVRIFDERFSISDRGDPELEKMSVVIDTSTTSIFVHTPHLATIFGAGKVGVTLPPTFAPRGRCSDAKAIDLNDAKRRAYDEGRSFVFSDEFYQSILEHRHALVFEADDEHELDKKLLSIASQTISSLGVFAKRYIHIISSRDAGNALAGTIELAILEHDLSSTMSIRDTFNRMRHSSDNEAYQLLCERFGIDDVLRIDGPCWIHEHTLKSAENMLRTINTVISQIVPDLSISIETLDTIDASEAKRGATVCVEVMSHRFGKEIPFACESGGIKRIFSFVNYLILMFNERRILLAIDELDSGIFEYLLGELLSVVAEHGEGQLVFTSHNLRPLETIDQGYIHFTTTNPRNRFVKMVLEDSGGNLRDTYYRDILLGGQEEELYDPTNNGKIALALMEAVFEDES